MKVFPLITCKVLNIEYNPFITNASIKGVAEMHVGQFRVESKVNEGSEFIFSIPCSCAN